MSQKIRVAINGYGNLGRGTEIAASNTEDIEIVTVFTRRDPASVKTLGAPVSPLQDQAKWVGKVDVCINCGGSATDLATQTPQSAAHFNVVDSFDTHPKIPAHFAAVDQAARAADTLALISAGWDPGMFSIARLYGEAILPQGRSYTFWGTGVSQGHSDAIRRLEGVIDARQYTIPVEQTRERILKGENLDLDARQMHRRECWVVTEEGADQAEIERQIVTMEDYFAPYNTTVHFISAAQLAAEHSAIPHGGSVIRQGQSQAGVGHVLSFGLTLDSNPEFTASVLVAGARAVARLAAGGQRGALTMLEVPPAMFSPQSITDLRAHCL